MNLQHTALVLLELQNDFLSEGGKFHPLLKPVLDKYRVIDHLNILLKGARALGLPVIHTPLAFSDDYHEMGEQPCGILAAVKAAGALRRGSWGAQPAAPVVMADSDVIIDGKTGIDAFIGTALEQALVARGIREIVLAGQLTNICIESTMRAAYDKGYRLYGITDASATLGEAAHDNAIAHNWPMFCEPLSTAQFLQRAQEAAAAT